MTDLKRWIEEGAPEAIERLLQAAESEEPSAASLASTLASLGVASALTSVTSSAAAGAAESSGIAASAGAGTTALAGAAVQGKLSVLALTASLAKWIALGSVVGGATVVAIDTMTEPKEVPPVSAVRTAAAPLPPRSPASAAVDQIAAAPNASASAGVERTVASKAEVPRAARAPVARAAPAPIAVETLAEEIAGIDRARSLLAAGRYAATSAALDDYERRFPKHHFGPEVLYLRMEAATGAGRTGEARRLAQRLLASYPQSPQSEKAKQLLLRKK